MNNCRVKSRQVIVVGIVVRGLINEVVDQGL
jgi:hypothetical protein